MSVSLFFSPYISHITAITWYGTCLSLSDLLNIIPSRSIHIVSNGKIVFFLWLNTVPLCMNICVYMYKGSFFSTSLSILVIYGLFDYSYSDKCEVIVLYGFDFHFPYN